MTALLLAAVVGFTLPCFADSSCYHASTTRIHALDSLRVWYQVSGTTVPRLALVANVSSLECSPYSVTIPTTEVATAWIETKQVRSPWACKSNLVTVNGTLGVPVGSRVRLPELWLSVTGAASRTAPTTPGIYFHRTASGTVEKWRVVR